MNFLKLLFSYPFLILLLILSSCNDKTGVSDKQIGFTPDDTAFVLITDAVAGIKTDVRYATNNNFTGRILYHDDRVFLRKIVADSLKSVQMELMTMGFSLKIYDGYRPLSVQKIMWEILPDTNYVADPAVGSRHNRGAAVDLTIVDSEDIELDMGTGYDDFTEKANPDYTSFSDKIVRNRKLLADVMTKHGFTQYKTEWWHFDFHRWNLFTISDFRTER